MWVWLIGQDPPARNRFGRDVVSESTGRSLLPCGHSAEYHMTSSSARKALELGCGTHARVEMTHLEAQAWTNPSSAYLWALGIATEWVHGNCPTDSDLEKMSREVRVGRSDLLVDMPFGESLKRLRLGHKTPWTTEGLFTSTVEKSPSTASVKEVLLSHVTTLPVGGRMAFIATPEEGLPVILMFGRNRGYRCLGDECCEHEKRPNCGVFAMFASSGVSPVECKADVGGPLPSNKLSIISVPEVRRHCIFVRTMSYIQHLLTPGSGQPPVRLVL